MNNLLSAVKLRREGPLCLMTEYKEAVWSSYMSITKQDTSILNRLVDVGVSPRVEESKILAPFGPYFRVNTPSIGIGSSPFFDP